MKLSDEQYRIKQLDVEIVRSNTMKLSDEQYRIKQLELIIIGLLEQLHLEQPKPIKKFPFHGGCLECNTYKLIGTIICKRCQYYSSEWDKPDLSFSV